MVQSNTWIVGVTVLLAVGTYLNVSRTQSGASGAQTCCPFAHLLASRLWARWAWRRLGPLLRLLLPLVLLPCGCSSVAAAAAAAAAVEVLLLPLLLWSCFAFLLPCRPLALSRLWRPTARCAAHLRLRAAVAALQLTMSVQSSLFAADYVDAATRSLNDMHNALQQKDQNALNALLAKMDELLQMNRGPAASVDNRDHKAAPDAKLAKRACPICPVCAAVYKSGQAGTRARRGGAAGRGGVCGRGGAGLCCAAHAALFPAACLLCSC